MSNSIVRYQKGDRLLTSTGAEVVVLSSYEARGRIYYRVVEGADWGHHHIQGKAPAKVW